MQNQNPGLPGDTVMYGQYTERLRSLISTAATPYDFIIVQGGGNDLLMCGEPQEIFGALRKLWSIAFEAGSKVIALTVTKTIGENDRLAGRYDALNELIVSEEHEKLYSVDVSKILSPTTMDKVMVSRIYDRDGVHFGKKGYEMMGDAIASSLAEMIQAEPRGKDNADPTSHSPKHHFNASNSEPHSHEASTINGD